MSCHPDAAVALFDENRVIPRRRALYSRPWKREDERKKRLVLLEPSVPGRHVFSDMKLPRMGTVLLGTIMRNLGWEVKVYVEDIAPIDFKEMLKADVVGISTLSGTAVRAYQLADALRDYGVPVIMGGPHVSFLPAEALEHSDYVIRGEGEEALPKLLDALFGKGRLEHVPNLCWRGEDGRMLQNEWSSTIEDLDSLPYADFSLIQGFEMTKNFHFKPILPMIFSRGCPFGCNFCSVIQMFGRKMRYRSVDNIIGELEQYRDRDIHVFFYDDNFTANRKNARELLERAGLDMRLFGSWASQVRTDIAKDDEMLDLFRRTGCKNLYIGFESANPEALKEMNKRQTVEDMQHTVRKINEYGLDVHGMFIMGFDSDTAESLKATTDFACESGTFTSQFMVLTPFPGTPLFEKVKSEGRITTYDWSQYDALHAVIDPMKIDPWDLQRLHLEAYDRYYSRRRAVGRLVKRRFIDGVVLLFCHRLVTQWRKLNRPYLEALEAARIENRRPVYFAFDHDPAPILSAMRKAARSLWPRGPLPAARELAAN